MVELQAQPWASATRSPVFAPPCWPIFVWRPQYAVQSGEGLARPTVAVDLSRLRSLTGVLSVMAWLQQSSGMANRIRHRVT